MGVSNTTIAEQSQDGGNPGDRLKRPVVISLVGHLCLIAGIVWGAIAGHGSLVWGESGPGGSAASVQLVSAASIPLPPPAVDTTNKVANEEPGLHYSEAPKPEPKPVPEKAVELPGRSAKRREKPVPPKPRQEARVHRLDQEPPPPQNEIPYGAGGPAQGPYGMFRSDAGTGGVAFRGGAGDFGSRYNWYVSAIRSRISSNWLQATIDPNIRSAPRVYVAFQILRDGQVANPQLIASSGIASLDRSALRAIYESNPMPPLPGDYPGSSVSVEFWFDLKR